MVYNHFKTFHVDLNNDHLIDTIVLSSSMPGNASFNRISILMSGARRAVFKAKNEWAEIQPDFLADNKNLLNSRNIFVKKTKIHTVIILSGGTDAAGYGGEFSIINIENNNTKMVFDYGFGDAADSIDVDIEIPTELDITATCAQVRSMPSKVHITSAAWAVGSYGELPMPCELGSAVTAFQSRS